MHTVLAHETKIYGLDWSRKSADEFVTCSLDKTIKVRLRPRDLVQVTTDLRRAGAYPISTRHNIQSSPRRPFGELATCHSVTAFSACHNDGKPRSRSGTRRRVERCISSKVIATYVRNSFGEREAVKTAPMVRHSSLASLLPMS